MIDDRIWWKKLLFCLISTANGQNRSCVDNLGLIQNRFKPIHALTRVDLHRQKILTIQFLKPSLWQNINHSISYILLKWCHRIFKELFFLFWHKNWCIVLNKEKHFLSKKTLIIQFPYIEIERLAFFFDGDNQIFFNKHYCKKKFCMQNLNFSVHKSWIHKNWIFPFFFWIYIFFQKHLTIFSLYGMVMYALILVC